MTGSYFDKPKVAILLAAYNGKNWLLEQLESILTQEKVDPYIFISVDLSNDGTFEWCKKFASSNKRIFLLSYFERFGAAAPNFYRLIRDVDFAEFDFIGFSDQDDIWLLDKLSRGVACIRKEGCDGYSSNVIAFWQNGKRRILRKSQPQKVYDYIFEGAGPGCTYIMTRKLAIALKERVVSNWNMVKYIDWHDWLTYAYARANNFSWYIDSVPGMLYRQHQNNQIGMNFGIKALLKRARKIVNGYGLGQARIIAQVTGADKDPIIRKLLTGNKKGLLLIICKAGQCRRKLRDRLFLIIASFIMLIFGDPMKLQDSKSTHNDWLLK